MRPRIAGGLVPLGALARGAAPLARNLAGMLTGLPAGAAPAFVTWGITTRCPLRCLHCDMGEPVPEMSHDERLALARAIGESGVWAVSLVGGEVTIVRELPDYAEILKRHGKWVSLATSGLGLARHLDRLLAAGVDSYTFSVDSHRPEAHDAFRGPGGLFRSILDAIERIRAARRGDAPSIQIRCTINRQNFRELGEYMRFWDPLADNIVLQIVQDNGIHHVRDHAVMFRPEDRPALEEVLAGLRARYPRLRTKHNELMPRYVFEPAQLHEDLGFRCLLVPATSAVILPDGDVRLCYGREDSLVGNVRRSTLAEIWRSDATQETQRRMQSREYGCMCWEQACGGNLELIPIQDLAERAQGLARGLLGRAR